MFLVTHGVRDGATAKTATEIKILHLFAIEALNFVILDILFISPCSFS